MSNIDQSDMSHEAATDGDGPSEERSTAGTGVGFAMRRGMSVRRRRGCPLSGPRAPIIDYKNILLLKRYVSEGGRMLPRRITAVSAKKQRELSCAIKRARILALLPFTSH